MMLSEIIVSCARSMTSSRHRFISLALFITILFVLFIGHPGSLTPSVTFSPPRLSTQPPHEPAQEPEAPSDTPWSRFAYTQYVTNSEYLCNSVMFFEALNGSGSKADRVMMYPDNLVKPGDTDSLDSRIIAKARDQYNVKLVPIKVQHKDNSDPTWADSFTKLLAFNQTQYQRVLSIDSDSMLLQHMDELFLLPSTPVAMPRAYWLYPDKEILSSQVVLIEPSDIEFSRISKEIDAASRNDYDMEIVNYLYRDSAMVLPHRKYDLLTGEFRSDNHTKYLGSNTETWDPTKVYNEAKLIHFSDWPLPKPWLPITRSQMEELQPKCTSLADGGEDCTSRTIWHGIYADFKKKREKVCS